MESFHDPCCASWICECHVAALACLGNISVSATASAAMSDTKVSKYIEEKWEQEYKSKFVDFEWLKVYLVETVQNELDLVDLFFSTEVRYTVLWKTPCAFRMTQILLKLADKVDSMLVSEDLIENNTRQMKTLVCSSLNMFLIKDLATIILDYSVSIYFQLGMYIDTMDAEGTWGVGEIKQILRYKSNSYLLIHYLEFDSHYDELINTNANRIRLLYDDSNQIVYNWAPVNRKKSIPVEYRLCGETNWRSCRDLKLFSRLQQFEVLAPAGTFIK